MTEQQQLIYKLVKEHFKNEDGSPVLLSPSQCDIFATISMKLHPRNHCMTFTRFGKSRTTALAVLMRATTFPEKWSIVAPTKEKAKIVMNYINGHIFDTEYVASKFRMEKGDSAEAIRRHRNKSHLTFDLGNGRLSEIFITSAKDAIGHGAPNVIEDEASLIPNDEHALVMRMLGDDADKNFLFKIGNPFRRNHFLDSFHDPAYNKILVTAEQGVHEGRISKALIEEMSKFSFFDVLYKCEFPSAESVDSEGWMYLLTEADIQKAKDRWPTTEKYGRKKLGNDIARGGRNFNVWALRGENYATILQKDHDNNLMSVAGKNIGFMQEHHIADGDVFLDDVGVGGGVTDRMLEEGYHPTAIKEGAKATETEKRFNPKTGEEEDMAVYANMRAQLYAGKNGLQHWVKYIGALDPEIDWSELTKIRYKKDGSGRIIIESKDDMRKRGEESPDEADALMLTFGGSEVFVKKEFHAPDPSMLLNNPKKFGYLK